MGFNSGFKGLINHLMHGRDKEKVVGASERSYFSYSNTDNKVHSSERFQAVPARPSGRGFFGGAKYKVL